MIKNERITTTIKRIVTVDFYPQQIDEIMRKACGFDESAEVMWDVGEGYIRSVCVVSTTTEQS